jgi:heat shock protein HslJ
MKIYLYYLVLGLILLISGCATPQQEVPVLQSSLDGDWQSTHSRAYVRFDHGKLSGSDGCNRFGGSYTVEGSRLSVGENMMSTMMACPNMDKSQAFKEVLKSAKFYENDGKVLNLLGEKGDVLETLFYLSSHMKPDVYYVTHYNNGKGSVINVDKGSFVSLELLKENKVIGSTGCNDLSSSYTTKDNNITIGFPAMTRKMCAPQLMEQEKNYITALSRAHTISRNGDAYELRDEKGSLQVVLKVLVH